MSLRRRGNKAMNTLMAGLDLEQSESFDWPGEIQEVLEEGWVRRKSGALVLAHIARQFNHLESDYYDLTAYEASVNQVYVPDEGIDLSSKQALAMLAERGYALTATLMSRAADMGDVGELVGVISVAAGFEGKPGGNIHVHELHDGERPWIRLDDLDGYQEEAIMALEMGDAGSPKVGGG